MNRFNMWMQRLLYGRYGNDSLNRFLLGVGLVMIIAGIFYHGYWLRLLTVLVLILIYCRMFSRNFAARARENQKFLEIKGRRSVCGHSSYRSGTGYGSSSGWNARPQKDKTHKILRCPSCGEKLRVPKGVGKISITCPYCSLKFIKKV